MVLLFIPLSYLLSASISFLGYGLIIGFLAGIYYYDKQSEINRYLVSLPVTRKQIILARYLFCLLVTVSFYLYMFILDFLFFEYFYEMIYGSVPMGLMNNPMSLSSLYIYLGGAIILLSIYLPVYVKLPYFVALAIQMISLVLLPSVIFMLLNLFEILNMDWLLQAGEAFILFFLENIFPSMIILTVICALISYSISRAIFLKKDFS